MATLFLPSLTKEPADPYDLVGNHEIIQHRNGLDQVGGLISRVEDPALEVCSDGNARPLDADFPSPKFNIKLLLLFGVRTTSHSVSPFCLGTRSTDAILRNRPSSAEPPRTSE